MHVISNYVQRVYSRNSWDDKGKDQFWNKENKYAALRRWYTKIVLNKEDLKQLIRTIDEIFKRDLRMKMNVKKQK